MCAHARARVLLRVCRPRPTHTAQRPSYTHIHARTHSHPCHSKTHNTYIKLQNRKKKKKVPHKTLQTSFFRNSEISDHHQPPTPPPFTVGVSRPPIMQENIILLRMQSKRNTYFHLVSLFLEIYLSGEIQSQPRPQRSAQYSCFLSSPSRCPCHAIMRNSVQTSPHKGNAHKRRFKEPERSI